MKTFKEFLVESKTTQRNSLFSVAEPDNTRHKYFRTEKAAHDYIHSKLEFFNKTKIDHPTLFTSDEKHYKQVAPQHHDVGPDFYKHHDVKAWVSRGPHSSGVTHQIVVKRKSEGTPEYEKAKTANPNWKNHNIMNYHDSSDDAGYR